MDTLNCDFEKVHYTWYGFTHSIMSQIGCPVKLESRERVERICKYFTGGECQFNECAIVSLNIKDAFNSVGKHWLIICRTVTVVP